MEWDGDMIPIADILLPSRIELNLQACSPTLAIDEVAALFKHAPEVDDWGCLIRGLQLTAPCLVEATADFAICIPHIRGDCVNRMVMGVGRSLNGVPRVGESCPVRYFFCIGVPRALAADYLRIIGLLARVFKDSRMENELSLATTPEEFVAILSQCEARI